MMRARLAAGNGLEHLRAFGVECASPVSRIPTRTGTAGHGNTTLRRRPLPGARILHGGFRPFGMRVVIFSRAWYMSTIPSFTRWLTTLRAVIAPFTL
jgi:hypothetical protein